MRFLIVLFLTLYSYAAIRYHLGKHHGITEFLFVINKALAWWCATMLLLSIFSNETLGKISLTKRATGLYGYAVALIHICLTIYLLNPIYYPNFFSGNSINFSGWISILFGVLSIIFFSFPLVATWRNLADRKLYKLGRLGILLNVSHVFSIGFGKWFPAAEWPLYLPPITLLFVVQALLLFVYRYLYLKN